jgi:hypothetical protein
MVQILDDTLRGYLPNPRRKNGHPLDQDEDEQVGPKTMELSVPGQAGAAA